MMHFSRGIVPWGLGVSLLVPIAWSQASGVRANPLNRSAELVSLRFPDTSGSQGNGSPRQTTGAGSRSSSCLAIRPNEPPMTVLLPSNGIGTMAAENPSLSLYFPRNTAKAIEVTVSEVDFDAETFEEVYANDALELPSSLKERPGIATLTLEDVNLRPNRLYKWTVNAICDLDDRSKDAMLWGLFERRELEADLIGQLEGAAPLKQAQLYAEAGVWQEALAIAAGLRSSNPDEWTEFLQSVGLGEISTAPFVE